MVRRKYAALEPALTERSRRVWAAAEARALGHGGIGVVERATGISRSTIQRGLRELETGAAIAPYRTRPPRRGPEAGGGQGPAAAGGPRCVGRGPRRRGARIRRCAGRQRACVGWRPRCRTWGTTSATAWWRICSTSWTTACKPIARRAKAPSTPIGMPSFGISTTWSRQALRTAQPAVSVDTKKKELVGDFKNPGRTWRPKGTPTRVRVHDFLVPAQGKAIPYGVYDLHRNEGWVSVGIDHDTASFAVQAIRRWWRVMGRSAYPEATTLLITADAGGSNGSRLRLWKWELQQFATRTGLAIHVCHFPPGTSKWNKIEHRLFSHIARNWRGHPLVSLAAIVSLIADTRTDARTPRPLRNRSAMLSRRHDRQRCADGADPPAPGSLPRRLELRHPPEHLTR